MRGYVYLVAAGDPTEAPYVFAEELHAIAFVLARGGTLEDVSVCPVIGDRTAKEMILQADVRRAEDVTP